MRPNRGGSAVDGRTIGRKAGDVHPGISTFQHWRVTSRPASRIWCETNFYASAASATGETVLLGSIERYGEVSLVVPVRTSKWVC